MKKHILLTLLIIFAGYLIWLGISGTNSFYISQRYYVFNFIMSVILMFYMVIGLWRSILYKKKNDKSDISINSSWYLISAFIFLIFIGIIIIPQPVTAGSASNRNLNIVSDDLDAELVDFNPFLAPDTEKLTISEWVKLINYTDRYEQFAGKKANVVGFIFQFGNTGNDFNKESDTFKVGRFIISCCAVDATPVGILVDNESDLLQDFSENDWVNIKGEWKLKEIDGEEQLVLVPSEINLTDIPDQPYEF